MPAGRPSEYDPAYCALVERCGEEGMGLAEIAAEVGVVRNTLRNWMAEYPDFLNAMTRAEEKSLAWWSSQGRKGIWSRDFNAPAYRLQVLNRFRDEWSDKSEQHHTGNMNLIVETGIERGDSGA